MAKKSKTKAKAPEKQFTIKMENGRVFKTIIETLATIIDKVKFTIDAEKLQIKTMDPSRICALQLTLSSKYFFDDYQCNGKTEICLNLETFDEILQCYNYDESIELIFQENAQQIKIKMERENSLTSKTFSLALLTDDNELPPQMDTLLSIKYDAIWSMNPDTLIEAIKCAEIYSEVLNIKTIETGLIISSSKTEFEYDISFDDLIEANISKNMEGVFNIKFLKTIMILSPITEKLEISLKTITPLKMIFNLLDGGLLEYFLAPRVETVDLEGE